MAKINWGDSKRKHSLFCEAINYDSYYHQLLFIIQQVYLDIL